ncbi:hypothetical protein J6590_044317 [Homalodisca vitripennis]|nr:hypothetical protein J6590_044317 [Homalodisca vitripennis]
MAVHFLTPECLRVHHLLMVTLYLDYSSIRGRNQMQISTFCLPVCVTSDIYNLTCETVVLLLECNPDMGPLLDWVVDRCYTAKAKVADGCFLALATIFSARLIILCIGLGSDQEVDTLREDYCTLKP